MKSKSRYRLVEEQSERDIKSAETHTLFAQVGLVLAGLTLFAGGVVAHHKNAEERKSRLFYELDPASSSGSP